MIVRGRWLPKFICQSMTRGQFSTLRILLGDISDIISRMKMIICSSFYSSWLRQRNTKATKSVVAVVGGGGGGGCLFVCLFSFFPFPSMLVICQPVV